MTAADRAAGASVAAGPRRRGAADTGTRGLRAALTALAALPALAVMPGLEAGRLAFLEYREPKLIVALVAATAFVALFVWHHGLPRTLCTLSRSVRESPELAVLGLLLGYMVIGGAWVEVRENWWYEVRQYTLFFVVVLLVRAWAAREPRVTLLLASTVCAATALLVAIGLVQAAGALPWLVPIDPGYGVGFPSLLGYKNPMALAVVGQLFLLPLLALHAAEAGLGRRRRNLLLAGLATAFAVECGYVAFLQSRTSYLSLAAGLALLLAVSWRSWLRPGARGDTRPWRPWVLRLAIVAAAGALVLSFALQANLRARLASVKTDYVDGWSGSDRATYLLNSVAMARDRPLGVGLGDWQTHYPVYRPWNPGVAFSETVQPRRAHDDHAQLLAELGVPGFLLWVGFWAALLWRRFFPRSRERLLHHRLLGVQCAVFLVAMAGDYVLEHPYLKLQFFLVLALAGPAGGAEPERARLAPKLRRVGAAGWFARAAVLLLLAGTGWEAWRLAERLHDAGLVRYHYARWAEHRRPDGDPAARREAIRDLLGPGERFVRGRGHTKTFFKDYLAVAEATLASGRPNLANELAWESLRLHPYNSQAFRLLAEIWAPVDPEVSGSLLRAHRYILDGPEHGFQMPYPPRRPLRWNGSPGPEV